MQKALKACQSLRPKGGFGGGRFGGGTGANAQALQAYRSCLSDHGITLPAGGFGGRRNGGSTTTTVAGAPVPTTIDRNSPAYQAAAQACQALMPAGFGGSTTTTVPAA
jgi:hypothetical protein